jgi:hypothetical protein
MDWVKRHEGCEASPARKARLRVVREHVSRCLDFQPPGPVKVLSICAGDARDLIGLLAVHPRRGDVTAYLVENDGELAEAGQATISDAGFGQRLKFLRADATISSTYLGLVPADVVLVAGVFANLRPEEVARLIGSLPSLCKRGGFVVWTRHRRFNDGLNQIASIRQHLRDSGFEEVDAENASDDGFIVGTHRYAGAEQVLHAGMKLFEFTGYDQV